MSENAAAASVRPAVPAATPRRQGNALRTLSIVSASLLVVAGAIGGTLMAISSPGDDMQANGATFVSPVGGDPVRGRQLTMNRGCVTCHSDDGSPGRGPTYKGLFGSTVTYSDGTTGVIDSAEVREALAKPNAKVIAPFEPGMMPPTKLTEEETINLIAYLHSIGAHAKK